MITWQVVVGGPLARADERFSDAVVRPGRFAELLADLGGVAVAVPVLVVALGYAGLCARSRGLPRWWAAPAAAAALMAVLPGLIVPLKEVVARPGPPVMGPGTGFYPSGHTATAVVAYGAAVVVLLPWFRTALARRVLIGFCAVLNLAVAAGLVRRGYHFPLDVVGSWCLCLPLLAGLAVFLRRVTSRALSRSSR
ncbi:phosphatase PAP2 family protein [Streptomyces sp. NPDC059786]|uniref:phosphatase PAP2 family protein n=1 Tax=Streptomyces sp. NPDC059786 TaxID=3346946 RepID=UPI003654ACF0